MPAVARVGDQGSGTCFHPSHQVPVNFTCTFLQGEPVSMNGQHVVTVGCVGVTSCGHQTVATSGSTSVFGPSGAGVHRVGDVGVVVGGGNYVVVSGASGIDAGD